MLLSHEVVICFCFASRGLLLIVFVAIRIVVAHQIGDHLWIIVTRIDIGCCLASIELRLRLLLSFLVASVAFFVFSDFSVVDYGDPVDDELDFLGLSL